MKTLTAFTVLCVVVTASASLFAGSPGYKSTQELMEKYRNAHETNDIKAAEVLYYWVGVDEETKKAVLDSFRKNFGRQIKSIKTENLKQTDVLEYTRNGIVYRPNLPTVGWLAIEFQTAGGETGLSKKTSYLLGNKEGRYYLTTAVPIQRKEQ